MSADLFDVDSRNQRKPDVLLRTRRSVMEAAHRIQDRRAHQRRNAGIALLVVAALLLLFAPALWSAASDLTAGEQFMDVPIMVLTLSLVLLAAMFAILLMTWRGRKQRVED